MNKKKLRELILPGIGIIVCALFYGFIKYSNYNELDLKNLSTDTIALLVPDKSTNKVFLKGWELTAEEEGLHIRPLTDEEFSHLYVFNQGKLPFAGVIYPDTIHKTITPLLANQLKDYVKLGGKLMLIYDAGTLDPRGNYYPDHSILSDLAGTQYALYSELLHDTIVSSYIGGNKDNLDELEIPPGKAMDPNSQYSMTSKNNYLVITGYQLGALKYSYFATQGIDPTADVLMTTPDKKQVIADTNTYGKGEVLFVNLPLIYLWAQTDGMFIHGFLHYFADQVLNVPILSAVPNGVGGLVMNWHVESSASLVPLSILQQAGIFKQHPYSIDVTAGPDSNKAGDGLGLDVLHNPITQKWLHYFLETGQVVGTDGGWMHNYYGWYVNDNNQSEFQKYLTWNIDALEKVTGVKMLEYTPPLANVPQWSINYLASRGIIGYYSASSTGAPPIENIRNGVFDPPNVWAFPVLLYGRAGVFEDFNRAHISSDKIQAWLLAATDFTMRHHTIRLIYFHPPGLMNYNNLFPNGINYMGAIGAWLDLAKELSDKHEFSWYTMAGQAQFLNTRKLTTWTTTKTNDQEVITATNPVSLANQAWFIKKSTCLKPQIIVGTGQVNEDDDLWVVVADDVKDLKFSCNSLA